MSEFPDDVKMVADGIAADIPSTVRKGNRPFISNVIARAIMADRAALSSAAVAEREPYGYVDEKSGCFYADHTPNPDGLTAVYLDPPPTSELEAENARLRDERYVAVAAMVRSHERSEAVEARLAEAMKALGPFAKAGELFPGEDADFDQCIYRPAAGDEYALSGNHLRAARRVLEGGK